MYVQRLGIFDIDQFDNKKIIWCFCQKKVCERLLIKFCGLDVVLVVCHWFVTRRVIVSHTIFEYDINFTFIMV